MANNETQEEMLRYVNYHKIVVFGAANKGTMILYTFLLPSAGLYLLENNKIQVLFNSPAIFKAESILKAVSLFSSIYFSRSKLKFSSTFQGRFNFKDVSRKSFIFKYFSSLCKPWAYIGLVTQKSVIGFVTPYSNQHSQLQTS